MLPEEPKQVLSDTVIGQAPIPINASIDQDDDSKQVTNDELVAAAIAEQLMQSGSAEPPEKLRKAFENT